MDAIQVKIVAFAGGVGGAKLADGLYRAIAPDELSVVVNTGDDFDLYGLRICPDADTVLYTLAGLANAATGWGVADDTTATLAMLRRYGEDTWFQLGDADFATHILRTQRLRANVSLTSVERELAAALGLRAALLPMCDESVATLVQTPAGELAFQDYFVRRHHTDEVHGVRFEGIERARPTSEVAAAIEAAEAILFCPSNPIVSIGPILSIPGMRSLVEASRAPKIAVSPIVGGKALRGPADRMLEGLGHEVSALGVAMLYRGLIDGFVIDCEDEALAGKIRALGMQVLVTSTVMQNSDDRLRLAMDVLAFAGDLRREGVQQG